MAKERLISIGSVVLVTDGKDANKIAVVVNYLSTTRLIIDGPTTNVKKQVINVRHLKVTPLMVRISKGIGSSRLAKFIKEQKVEEKWSNTSWSKKIEARIASSNRNDFERFTDMIKKKHFNKTVKRVVKTKLNKIKSVGNVTSS